MSLPELNQRLDEKASIRSYRPASAVKILVVIIDRCSSKQTDIGTGVTYRQKIRFVFACEGVHARQRGLIQHSRYASIMSFVLN